MKRVLIRELQSSDYQSLAIFNSSFPGDTRSETEWLARFKYWWDENPAYDDTWIRGFLLLDGDKIVGFVGSFPTLFKAGDEIVKAFNGTTWRVGADYRKYSIDLWEKNREISKHYYSFNTTPTDDVSKLITRMGYERYNFGEDNFSFLIRNRKLFAKLIPGRCPIYLKSLVTYILILWQERLTFLPSRKFKVLTSPLDNNDLDDLWKRTEEQYTFTNVRTKQTVEWYSRNKVVKYVYLNSNLVAFGIYLFASPMKETGCHITLADFWYDNKVNLYSMLKALIVSDLMATRGSVDVSSIKYPHFSIPISRVMLKLGLLKHNYYHTCFLRTANGTEFKPSSAKSYFTMLQGDFGT